MYKAVIFDLDGTILDTLNDLANAVNHSLFKFGFPLRTVDEVRQFVGNGIKNLIIRAVPEGTDEQTALSVLDEFKMFYGENSAVETQPYEGIIPCMQMLKQMGIKIAVVTNKAHFAAEPLCTKYFGNLVDVTIGEREGVRKKPHPDSVLEAMEILGVDCSECVYIGDSDVDIETANNSAIPCISVTWGFRGEAFLIESGASYIAHNINEMTDLIVHNVHRG